MAVVIIIVEMVVIIASVYYAWTVYQALVYVH